MGKEEKELSRFMLEPRYREKVLDKIRKNEDKKYKDNIKLLESEKQKLLKLRQKEIDRIENSRWEVLAGGSLRINRTEGKIIVNNSEVLFSSIKGAEVNIQNGFRMETKDNSKSKKHASIGGAIVGGAIAGPVGAVVGGAGLGKTKTKGKAVSNQIPTCTHIGVLVNIDGFMSEITVLSSQVDQYSFRYSSAYNEAQSIISKLRNVSQTPVPSTFARIEEEKSVRDVDKQIAEIETKLKYAIDEKPTYRIPDMYRAKEQELLGDKEYLEYLQEEDTKRENLKADKKRKQREIVLEENKKPDREFHEESVESKVYSATSIIKTIILWVITGFCLFIAIPSICGALEGILGFFSGVVMLILAMMACPVITKKTLQIDGLQIYYRYKKVIVAVLVIVYFVLIMNMQ